MLPTYQRRVYAVNSKLLWVLLGWLWPLLGFGQTTYTWNAAPGSTASWSAPASWSPTRTAPADSDILIFDGSVTATPTVAVDFTAAETPATQTIGQLRFVNGVRVTLMNDGNRTVRIVNSPMLGLTVTANSHLRVVGTNTITNAGLTFSLVASTRASISGRIEFAGPLNTGSGHRIVSGAENNYLIDFLNGSYFLADTGFTGNPFGTANRGTVVFRSGATYEQSNGATPFGTSSIPVTSFESGSSYIYSVPVGITSGFAAVGRQYGNLIINTGRDVAATGSSAPLTILNDFTVSNGIVNVQTAVVRIGGNLVLNGGSLAFSGNTLEINGTQPQAITGTNGTLSLNNLTLNNPTGLTLTRATTVGGTLALTQGIITSTGALTVNGDITGASANRYVDGPLIRTSSATATTSAPVTISFPVGKGANYRPLTLALTAGVAGITYTAEQLEGNPGEQTVASPLRRVSGIRRYRLVASSNDFTGTLGVSFGADDQVTDANAASLVIARNTGAEWVSVGRVANTGSTVTSGDFSGGGTFALGSTSNSATLNPLPVSLTSFTADRQGTGVRLRWRTASEVNNDRFEVQRSQDGTQFITIGAVAGQGTTSAAHAYTFWDEQPAGSAPGYYRLRQVDTNGDGVFSPVVVVEALAKAGSVFPNPVAHTLYVQAVPSGATYQIRNALGQVVLQGKAAEATTGLDVRHLMPGTYYLELTTPTTRAVHRFVKW